MKDVLCLRVHKSSFQFHQVPCPTTPGTLCAGIDASFDWLMLLNLENVR